MLTKKLITKLLHELNDELKKLAVVGELGLCGGAAMCLAFNARNATKDIDAIFSPTNEVRQAAKSLQKKHGLTEDWLNDAVKGFIHKAPPQQNILTLSNLRVWSPTPEYMLAMKCISARWDSHDKDDIIFLMDLLELKKPNDVYKIICQYYPQKTVPPKTQFVIEEILS